jgi:hypothetical protein
MVPLMEPVCAYARPAIETRPRASNASVRPRLAQAGRGLLLWDVREAYIEAYSFLSG